MDILSEGRKDYFSKQLSGLYDLVLNLSRELSKEVQMLDASENDRYIYKDSINCLDNSMRQPKLLSNISRVL